MAAYVEQHPGSPATIKQQMSTIRMLFSWLTEKGILAMNPAREVKTEKFSRTEGKTPAFDTEQVQKVLDKIDTSNEVGLGDRALLGTFAYTFARIGAVVNLKVEDYFLLGLPESRISWRMEEHLKWRNESPATPTVGRRLLY